MKKQLRKIVVDGKEYGWNRNGLVRERIGDNIKTGKPTYGKSWWFKPEILFPFNEVDWRSGEISPVKYHDISPRCVANWIKCNVR